MEWTHNGMTIKVGLSGRFSIEGDDDKTWFDTLELAKQEVNSRAAVEVKARHANLAMPVLDDQGRRHTIRGINRTSSNLQGIPERGVSTLYYPTARVEELVKERRELSARVAELSDLLHGTIIPNTMGYGRIRVEEYDARIERLRRAYEAAREAAEALTPGEGDPRTM